MLLCLALFAGLDSASVRDIQLAPDETLRITIEGSGRPVVFIPGVIGSAYAFRKVIPPLVEAGLQSIVIEPLGIGASARPSRADYSLTAQADRIAAVLDTIGVSQALVVAHSLSVSMALRLAYRRPDLVAGVLAVNGGPVEAAATPGIKRAVKFAFLIKLFGDNSMVRNEIRKGLVETSGDPSWITPEVLDGYTAGRAGDLGSVLQAMKGMAKAKEAEPLTPHLAQITIPVRLLIGAAPHGSGIVPANTRLLRERIPGLVVDSIPGAGLHIHEEQPEVMVRKVLEMQAALARGP